MARTNLERDVARILEGIEPTPTAHPALLIMVGLPGTGKTHLANELSQRTGAAVLESDAIRRLLFRERHYTPAENRRLFAAIQGAIDALLAAQALVILDATNLAERERTPLFEIADRQNAAPILVHVVTPDEVARQRLEQRRDGELSHSEAGLDVYERMRSRIEEICRPHHVIDTSKNNGPALDALTKEMTRS